MLRRVLSLAVALVAFHGSVGLAQFKGKGKVDGGKFGWLPTVESGLAEARRTGKPLWIVLRCVP